MSCERKLTFQALYTKCWHFSNLENTTGKIQHFQRFQAPVQTLFSRLTEQSFSSSNRHHPLQILFVVSMI